MISLNWLWDLATLIGTQIIFLKGTQASSALICTHRPFDSWVSFCSLSVPVPQWDGVMREARAPLQPLHTLEVLGGTSLWNWTLIILVMCLKWFSTHWHYLETWVVFLSRIIQIQECQGIPPWWGWRPVLSLQCWCHLLNLPLWQKSAWHTLPKRFYRLQTRHSRLSTGSSHLCRKKFRFTYRISVYMNTWDDIHDK